MKNVRVLDCTLRDGGRIIDCAFPDQEIRDMTHRLANSKIDIIEVGFLRDYKKIDYQGNSTFFTDVDQIVPFLDKTKKNTMYVAFIDFGMCDIDTLKPYDGKSIDGIRFGFTNKNLKEKREEVIRWANVIKEKGYKLFIQGVNSLSYSDLEFLQIIELVNQIHPYSFGIVDTYGAMYMDDVDRLFSLCNHNMLPDICINFHSHNNYQLSFAFAQEVVKLSESCSRKVIIDGTLGGMGKVAGNLNTELIVDFLVRKKHYDYETEYILDMLDDYIVNYSMNHKWGYSSAALMGGIYKSHPNNIIYLTEKFRLDTKDIGKILSMIDPAARQRYDYDNIQRLYTEYVAEKIDDHLQLEHLRSLVQDKEVIVLVPGNSLNTHREMIDAYMNKSNAIIISVNFVADEPSAMAFFGNAKRYARLNEKRAGREVLLTSNITPDSESDMVFNYHSLINRNYKYFENSTIMLLNLLKRVNPVQITIAGFDGFDVSNEKNYLDATYQNDRHINEFKTLNKEISEMFGELVATMSPACKFKMLTPSLYTREIQSKAE